MITENSECCNAKIGIREEEFFDPKYLKTWLECSKCEETLHVFPRKFNSNQI